MRRKLNDLLTQRTARLTEAENALTAGKQEDYQSAMDAVENINKEIKDVQKLVDEQDKKFLTTPVAPSEAKDIAEERGAKLLAKDTVTFSADELRRDVFNAITLATGTLAEPTGVGTEIRGGDSPISSIIDQVSVLNLAGMSAYAEPYVITELDARGGKVTANAGNARAASTDPTFGVANIKPYEVNVTSYVDKNIARLTPANYYAKIYGMAMRALRRKVAALIVSGDGQASPEMFGITNAKNDAGNAIFASESLGSAIDVDTLDHLYFAYGSEEALDATARLLLTKANLKALGALRGTNEKLRLFKIAPDAANPNTGVITDGGVAVPYTIVSAIGDTTLAYGGMRNYELGLFGDYSIRVDESVKAIERMHTILGDVMVGGNLVVDKGFVVGTLTGGAG